MAEAHHNYEDWVYMLTQTDLLQGFDLQQLIFTLPVVPGKTQALKEFIATAMGPKWKEYDASQKRHGIHKETWFLQSTPQGDWIISYAELDDIQKAFGGFAVSTDPFDVWARDQTKEITGIDFSQPPQTPLPEQILKYGY